MNLARYHEPQRRPRLMIEDATPLRRASAFRVECHLFDWGDDSQTTNQIDRSVAAQESQVVQSEEGGSSAAQGSIALGRGAIYREAGSIGGNQTFQGDVNITSSDPNTVREALSLVERLSAETAAVSRETNDASRFLAGQSVAALAENRQAGSFDLWRTVVVILGLATAGVLAIRFWKQ